MIFFGISLPASGAETVPMVAADTVMVNGLLTSYWTVDESLCTGEKVTVRDRSGNPLGEYRGDFLKAVRMEGWGKGDGVGNDGRFLGYDPGQGFSRSDSPLDCRGRDLVPWETVAAGRGVPLGTRVRIRSLPANASLDPATRERLLSTTFVVRDRGSALQPGQLDIYLGLPTEAGFAAPFKLSGVQLALDSP